MYFEDYKTDSSISSGIYPVSSSSKGSDNNTNSQHNPIKSHSSNYEFC